MKDVVVGTTAWNASVDESKKSATNDWRMLDDCIIVSTLYILYNSYLIRV